MYFLYSIKNCIHLTKTDKKDQRRKKSILRLLIQMIFLQIALSQSRTNQSRSIKYLYQYCLLQRMLLGIKGKKILGALLTKMTMAYLTLWIPRTGTNN